MATGAIGRETRAVLRVLRGSVLLLVARKTLRRRAGELVAGVTLHAGLCPVCPGEGEGGQVVIEGTSPAKRRDTVALFACSPEACGSVRRIGCCGERATVTPVTVERHIDIFTLLLIDVAGLARDCLMRADQRKSGPRMALRHVWHEPRLRRVAPFAGAAQFVAMNVLMTTGTGRRRSVELQRLMTLTALYLCMLALQDEPGACVIESSSG